MLSTTAFTGSRRSFRIARTMLLSIASIAIVACGGSDATAPVTPGGNNGNGNGNGNGNQPAPIASLSMTPATASLTIGGTQQLTVTARDAAGAVLTGRTLSFASSATNIATVSASGVVTAVANGAASISVTSEGKSAQSEITVQAPVPAAVAAVSLTPSTLLLDAGQTSTLVAALTDANGNALAGRTVTWASASPNIATVDAAGKVTAVAAGIAKVTATSEGKSADAVVQVRRVVASVQIVGGLDTLEAYDVRSLEAVARDAAGDVIEGTPFVWTSSNVAIATVQSPLGVNNGTITGVDRGTVTVTATTANGRSATATRVVVIKYRSITAATQHTCDIASGGVAWCWGLNSTDARLGSSDIGDGKFIATPFRVPGERGYVQLVSFARFTCGLRTDGKAYCWGSNSWGTLGDGSNKAFSATPVAVGGNNTFTKLAAGADHACGITTTNALVCWGHNDWGQFGIGTTSSPDLPVVAAGGLQFKSVMASTSSTCGVTMNGTAYCWGGNGLGQMGDGERIAYGNVYKTTPSMVVGGLSFASITGGQSYTCALSTGGAAYCWGSNGGKFGNGNTTDSSSPIAVAGGHLFSQISSGFAHSCGVKTDGDVACWGSNGNGQIGTTSLTLRVPNIVPGIKASEAAASGIGTGGGSHSCAISRDRLTVYCWGRNDSGQLGNGATTAQAVVNASPSIVVSQKPL